MGSRSWTDEQLKEAVKKAYSIAQTLQALGLKATGGNYKGIRIHIDRLNLSTDHFTGQGWNVGERYRYLGIPRSFEDILVENSTYTNTSSLKNRLLNAKLLVYECDDCGISDWMNKPLSLQLEHKNGNNRDNRIENLTLLCPNCHSQTLTFAGKNIGRY